MATIFPPHALSRLFFLLLNHLSYFPVSVFRLLLYLISILLSLSNKKLPLKIAVVAASAAATAVGVKRRMKESSRKQGAASPCAACKLLRRRCALDCVFAPYFPADEPQKFANVHKVFGASNINKMLQELPEQQRGDAVSSMVYEANARVRDPVYGCVGAISSLQQRIDLLQTQLAIAQAEVVHLRVRQASSSSSSPVLINNKPISPTASSGSASPSPSPSSNILPSQTKSLFDMMEVGEESLW